MIYSRVDLYRPSSSHLQKQKLYIWSGQRLTGFPKQALLFTCLQYKSFEITVGKGEIARNEQFFLFPQCFLPFWRPLCLFHLIKDFRLQNLSVWMSLKFVVWERVNKDVFIT